MGSSDRWYAMIIDSTAHCRFQSSRLVSHTNDYSQLIWSQLCRSTVDRGSCCVMPNLMPVRRPWLIGGGNVVAVALAIFVWVKTIHSAQEHKCSHTSPAMADILIIENQPRYCSNPIIVHVRIKRFTSCLDQL